MALRIVRLGGGPPSVEGPPEDNPQQAPPAARLGDPNTPSMTGMLAPTPNNNGAKLLMDLFVDERTGRLVIQGSPTAAQNTMYFFAGEPVHVLVNDEGRALEKRLADKQLLTHSAVAALTATRARHPIAILTARAGPVPVLEALRDEVRDFARQILHATAGAWGFFDDDASLDHAPLTAVNPFGFVLEARRRSTPPEQLMRMGEEIGALIPAPYGGFANVSARLKAFTGQVDLAELVDSQRRARDIFASARMDPIMGGMVLQTLVDTGHLALLHTPSLNAGRDRRRRKVSAAPALVQVDSKQLSQISQTPGKGGSELLAMYLELKPERDDGLLLGLDGSAGPAAVERGYQQRMAELDPRAIPANANRPYLLGRVEELRVKIERVYQARIAGRPRAKSSGAYQLLDRLGAGGMAEVFRGTQTDDPTNLVAVKVILPELRDDIKFAQMFLDEARLARRIQHPNVVRVLTVGRGHDDLYLAMEYVDGLDFGELIRRGREQNAPATVDLVCRVIAEACAGLHAAHTARDRTGLISPILHRDVSPQNILVSRMGDVKLSDFGIAKAMIGDEAAADDGGGVKGKIPYLAPELLKGERASVRSDVYAMAMTIYAALAQLPFQRGERIATMRAILYDPLPPLSSLAPGIPPILDALLLTAAANNPEERHASAQQLQLELEEVLAMRPAVDVGAWARPLVGKRVDPGAPSRPITSIQSSTGITNPGTNSHIRTGVNSTTIGVPQKAETVVGAPLFDVNAEDIDLDDI